MKLAQCCGSDEHYNRTKFFFNTLMLVGQKKAHLDCIERLLKAYSWPIDSDAISSAPEGYPKRSSQCRLTQYLLEGLCYCTLTTLHPRFPLSAPWACLMDGEPCDQEVGQWCAGLSCHPTLGVCARCADLYQFCSRSKPCCEGTCRIVCTWESHFVVSLSSLPLFLSSFFPLTFN